METVKTYFEISTIVLGGIASVMAFVMACYFGRSKVGIARAVAIDKLAEAVNMAVIFVFALTYYLNWFEVMPLWAAISLRMVAIAAVFVSTIHLFYQTRKILSESHQHHG